jgi:hypothetical protein
MKGALTCLLGLSCLCSCTRYSYYISPFSATARPYHAVPLHADSSKLATYVSAAFAAGGSNHRLQDGTVAGQLYLHRANNIGRFQIYYGLNGSIGNYRVSGYHGLQRISITDTALINTMTGNKFVGGYGLNAGVNYVRTYQKSEWRVIGLETTYQREFGNYREFRQKLPDTSVNIIDKSSGYQSLGLFTDVIFRTRKGFSGFKFAYGFSLKRLSEYQGFESRDRLYARYASITLHFERPQLITFFQYNTGRWASGIQAGVSKRL